MENHAGDAVGDELVAVQVPRHMLTAVYAYIADQDGRRASRQLGDEPGAGNGGGAGDPPRVPGSDWEVQDFTRLLHDRRPSTARMLTVLDVLAAAPNEEFSTSSLASATGLTRGELSGGFSGFTRVCRSLRKGIWLDWPIQWNFGPSSQGGQGRETFYWLPEALAQRWTEARGPQ